MKYLLTLLAIIVCTAAPRAQETTELSMQGGRVYFEMASGLQQYAPASPGRWSFRLGAGADAAFGNIYTAGKYTLAGIEQRAGEDFPQSLVSFLRLGGGWFLQDRYGRRSLTPMISAGHVSDRVMPQPGETNLQFDGWGLTPGLEARYVVHSSFDPRAGSSSSVWWSTHFIQIGIHHVLSRRTYTAVSLSYNIVFDGFHLAVGAEYNTLEQGPRGWMAGLELGFSWLRHSVR
jgi:hypothetical protein